MGIGNWVFSETGVTPDTNHFTDTLLKSDVIDRVHIRDSYGNLISRPWMGSSFLGKRQRWEAVDILGGGDNDRFSPPLKKDMVITCEPGSKYAT